MAACGSPSSPRPAPPASSDRSTAITPDPVPRFGDRRGLRIGLLGGSFNPAHAGHAQLARALATRLRLHQVWLLVSPGNPLKPAAGMAPHAARLASARALARPRILATGWEAGHGLRYTADTLAELRRRFPRARFVFLMGSDAFAQLPRWRRWRRIAALVPLAVHGRAGSNRAALHGQAAHVLHRLPARRAGLLPGRRGGAWCFLALRLHPASATALRAKGSGLTTQ